MYRSADRDPEWAGTPVRGGSFLIVSRMNA